MLARMCHLSDHLDSGRSNIAWIDTANSASFVVYFQHNASSLVFVLSKDALQHRHNELHGCVVVVQQNNLVHGWRRQFGGLTIKNRSKLVFDLWGHEQYYTEEKSSVGEKG